MYIEITLGLILLFLIIIARQNSTRGGMQDENLKSMIYMLNSTRSSIEHLSLRQRILDRDNNFAPSVIAEKDVLRSK